MIHQKMSEWVLEFIADVKEHNPDLNLLSGEAATHGLEACARLATRELRQGVITQARLKVQR